MPKLWEPTIESHRQAVRDATLDATASLVARHGLAAVTMSGVAEAAGIGRATLYKYFPDVAALLLAWHERLVDSHLQQLEQARARSTGALQALTRVLVAYAGIRQRQPPADVSSLLHRGEHVARADVALQAVVRDVVAAAAADGDVRADVPADELAAYCVHALAAASALPSAAAVRRLVGVTMDGLRPQDPRPPG